MTAVVLMIVVLVNMVASVSLHVVDGLPCPSTRSLKFF